MLNCGLAVRGLLVVAGTALLTLVVTWPLLTCFGTCLGAGPDPLFSIFVLRWVVHALTTPGVRFLDAGIYAPYPGTLALGEYSPAYAPITFPAILATGNPIVAHNAILIVQYTVAAVGAAVLARRLLRRTTPAILAGVVFGYSPRLLAEAHNFQTLSVCWLPWLCLALERFLAHPTWGAASVLVGLWLVLAGASINIFMYALVTVAVVAIVALTYGRHRLHRTHLLRLAVVGVPGGLLLAAYLIPFRRAAQEWALGRTLAEVEFYSAPARFYTLLPPSHLLVRLLGVEGMTYADYWTVIPGICVATLALVGLAAFLRHDALRPVLVPYVVMSAAAGVLALGPTLHTPWGPWPLPYRAIYEFVPGFQAIRTPARFLAFVGLGVALLAATGAGHVVRGLPLARARMVIVGLAALSLVEALPQPFPGTLRRIVLPDVYRWLGTQEPHTLTLELPMGDDWSKVAGAAFHLRRTVNGWASYSPPHYAALRAVMARFPDQRTVALVRGLRPDIVLVNRRWLDPSRRATLATLDPGFRLDRTIGDHLVFRLEPGRLPGVGQLEVAGGLVPPDGGRPWRACLLIRNPGPGYVPLYPVHRLRLRVEHGPPGSSTSSEEWLPLYLATAGSFAACVNLPARPESVTFRGAVEGNGQIHRFALRPAEPFQRLRSSDRAPPHAEQ